MPDSIRACATSCTMVGSTGSVAGTAYVLAHRRVMDDATIPHIIGASKTRACPRDMRNEDGMAKEQGTVMIAQNRKARHDYSIEDTYEAGLVLTGTEVKSLREGRASLAEAFVSIDRRGEMWLEAANIPEYLNGTWNNHTPKRKRKLLLHAAQIEKLQRQTQAKGYTIIPLSLYFKDGRVKAEIALARGKKEYDKRQALREEQDKREALRIMRYKNKQVI